MTYASPPNDSLPPTRLARPARQGGPGRLAGRKALALVGLALAAVIVIAGAAALLLQSPAPNPTPTGTTAIVVATRTAPPPATYAGLPTYTPDPTPNVAATVAAQYGQTCAAGAGDFAGATLIQGVAITPLTFQEPSYPGYELSPTLPDAPLKYPGFTINQQTPPLPLANPGNDPNANTGEKVLFDVSMCNTTNASVSLAQVWVKNTMFTPFTGPLNEARQCGLVYSRQNSLTGGGCGGGYISEVSMSATLTHANGTTQATIDSGLGPTMTLPFALAPQTGIDITINLNMPIGDTVPAGTYRFAAGIALGNGPVIYDTAQSPAAIYAVPTLLWDGHYCASASMQQQIPTTNPQQTYICPSA